MLTHTEQNIISVSEGQPHILPAKKLLQHNDLKSGNSMQHNDERKKDENRLTVGHIWLGIIRLQKCKTMRTLKFSLSD